MKSKAAQTLWLRRGFVDLVWLAGTTKNGFQDRRLKPLGHSSSTILHEQGRANGLIPPACLCQDVTSGPRTSTMPEGAAKGELNPCGIDLTKQLPAVRGPEVT